MVMASSAASLVRRVRVLADGSLSDMVNKARAKDAAWGIAERRVFVGDGRNVA
jgi:hypothetical protein